MQIPDKRECFYISEMLNSGLIDYSYLNTWADEIIQSVESPPSWLCELATEKYRGAQMEALGSFIYSEPFVPAPKDIEKFHVGCLWLRYKRREISWATFLKKTGEFLDCADCDWECETPYHYLNLYEDAYFTKDSEEETKSRYLKDHNLCPWINLARTKFEPFKSRVRLTKADPAET